MAENSEFNKKIIEAAEERIAYLDTSELPKLQEAYRLHLTCVRNLFESLVNKNLIIPDPYKKEKKISEVVKIDNSDFNENERAVVLGTRCSDYESMVDFVCNYMKFSVNQLNMDRIRNLLELNATFNWGNLTENSPRPNTKGLAIVIKQLRNGAPPILHSLIKDTTHKTVEALNEINNGLKKLAEFQKEVYKIDIRRNIFESASFDLEKYSATPAMLMAEIKRAYPSSMGSRPFSNELISEVVAEETAPDKEQRRERLLASFQTEKKNTVKKEATVDIHDMLMESIRLLGTSADQLDIILSKILANHDVIQSEHNTLGDKFSKFIRKLFGLSEPSIDYEVVITDKHTEAKKREKINFNAFSENLSKRIRYFSSFSVKNTPGYNKISAMPEEKSLEFLNIQISEFKKLTVLLEALDEHFKTIALAPDRNKIRGIKIELTSLNNIIVKVNQHRAEYVAFKEEQIQMEKLGIKLQM